MTEKIIGILFLALGKHLDHIIKRHQEKLPDEFAKESKIKDGDKFYPIMDGFCNFAKSLRVFGNILSGSKYVRREEIEEMIDYLNVLKQKTIHNSPPDRTGPEDTLSGVGG